jgi:tetratricopeptide (TPR) repeat protein
MKPMLRDVPEVQCLLLLVETLEKLVMRIQMKFLLAGLFMFGSASGSFGQTSALPSLETVNEQILIKPNDARLYVARAFVHQSKQKFKEAISDLSKAMSLNYRPEVSYDKGQLLYDCRANCYMHLRNWDAAIADYAKAININPNDAPGYGNRGVAYVEKKEFAKAVSDFSKAIQLDPRQPTFYEGMGEVCFKMHQYPRAIEYLNRAIKMDNMMGDAYYYRGVSYKALAKQTEATHDLEQADKLGFKVGELKGYQLKQ